MRPLAHGEKSTHEEVLFSLERRTRWAREKISVVASYRVVRLPPREVPFSSGGGWPTNAFLRKFRELHAREALDEEASSIIERRHLRLRTREKRRS